jgi:hypothetical protein
VFSGQFFAEWSPRLHVRELAVPAGTDVFCSMDWGYNAPGVLLWWACLPDGHYHLVRELKFQQDTAETVGRTWHAVNRELGIAPRYVVADPSMWAKTGAGRGESIAETLLRLRVPMRRGDNDRVNGWQRCHELLRTDGAGVPWLTVSARCAYLVRSLPAQMSDRLHPDDVDTRGDDHAVDALRYGAMSRPSPTRLAQDVKKLHPMLEEAIAGSQSRQVLGSGQVRRSA